MQVDDAGEGNKVGVIGWGRLQVESSRAGEPGGVSLGSARARRIAERAPVLARTGACLPIYDLCEMVYIL